MHPADDAFRGTPNENNVAVFDLDGTLTDTSEVDAECFVVALDRVFGIEGVSADWSNYQNVTDSSILAELFKNSKGGEPSSADVHRFVEEFVSLLDHAHRTNPNRFREIPGARSLLTKLHGSGWTVTIATGGWRASALRKLQFAGFHERDWIMATANDATKRTDIVCTSLARAGVSLSTKQRIVVFGDATWDVLAARDLGLPLIGVSHEPRAAKLREAGAIATVQDFSDTQAILGLMEKACESGSPGQL